MQPVLCYTGSKRHLADKIASHLQNGKFYPDAYYEPFCGGASVYFALKKRSTCKYYLSCKNKDVINFHTQIRDKPLEVIGTIVELKNLYQNHNNKRGVYRYFRSEFNVKKRKPHDMAALFYVLPKLSHKQLIRYNTSGEFNASYDPNRTTIPLNETEILNASKHLQGVNLQVQDYTQIKPEANDVVYIDPPSGLVYLHGKPPELSLLRSWIDSLPCRWVMSYKDTPEVRDAFKGFRFYSVIDKSGLSGRKRHDCLIVNANRSDEGTCGNNEVDKPDPNA